MKAAAGAILLQLQETVGYPFTTISADMYRYGGGGVAAWGTLCGTPNGACAMINLVVPAADVAKLCNELLGWYSETALPVTSGAPSYSKFDSCAQSVAGNPLCHASVSNWCETSGFKESSDERLDRCARLSGDVAAKAIEILNDYFAGKFVASYKVSAETAECQGCHVGKDSMLNDSYGKMSCVSCHDDPHE